MHYLVLTTIAILLWSSLASLVANLAHIPPFFLLAVTLLAGGSLSLRHVNKWQFNLKLLLVGVTGIFGYHCLLFLALRNAPPVSANLLNYLWPILILLLSPKIFPDISLKKRHYIGGITAFSGAVLVIYQPSEVISLMYVTGYLYAVFAALIWALYSLLSKKITTFSSAMVGLFCLISGALSLIVHFMLELTPELTSVDIKKILMLGIGPMGIAFYCWDSAVKKGDPRIIAVLSYFTPLLSTLFLTLSTQQTVSSQLLYALVFISGGAIIATIPSKGYWQRKGQHKEKN